MDEVKSLCKYAAIAMFVIALIGIAITSSVDILDNNISRLIILIAGLVSAFKWYFLYKVCEVVERHLKQ